jgi:hypothetical protein
VKIAVDVCVGKKGVAILRAAGHEVLEAEHAEPDRDWFARALKAGVDLVIANDRDLEILCYDANVQFFRVWRGHSGKLTALRVLERLARKRGTP